MQQSEIDDYQCNDVQCPECDYQGKSYKAFAKHYSLSHGDVHPLIALHGFNTIARLYAQMSVNKMSDELGVSTTAISAMVKETDGIEYRSQSEAATKAWADVSLEERRKRTEPGAKAASKLHPTFYYNKGYLVATDACDAIGIHRLVAVAEYGIEAVKEMHVHHDNGVRWDNRVENLKLMTPSDHARHHREEQLAAQE